MLRLRLRLSVLAFHVAACIALAAATSVIPGESAFAQEPIRQVDLTENQIQGFIAAQKPMSDVNDKIQDAPSDKPDPKLQAELEAIAKKNGFKDFAEYDDVASTISMVMAGIDPETKQYTPADVAIKKDIADLEADKSLPADERTQALKELNEALKQAQPIRNPANVDLVKKYYDKIEAVLQ
jgi:hypothetical protein